MRSCAVSVDLDEVAEYRALHGLPATDEPVGPVYRLALGRIAAFAAEARLPLTLFAVGRDLDEPRCAAAVAELADGGHLVDNHSWSHRYDLVRTAPEVMREEVRRGADAIERTCGRRPRGFRAPGYAVSDALFDALEAEAVAYDASVFPSPPYYLAKALAMAALRLRGRATAAVLGDPRVLLAPSRPYRPGDGWSRRGARALIELPISVTRGVRLPFIGTTLTMAGERGARLLTRGCLGEPLVSLELHAIDFLDVHDGLADLRGLQPDVSIPWRAKRRALHAAVALLRDAGYHFVTLEQAFDTFNGIL